MQSHLQHVISLSSEARGRESEERKEEKNKKRERQQHPTTQHVLWDVVAYCFVLILLPLVSVLFCVFQRSVFFFLWHHRLRGRRLPRPQVTLTLRRDITN